MIFGSNWILITLIAITIDFILGEFPCKQPVEFITSFIKWYESNFYKNSIYRGFALVFSLTVFILCITILIILGFNIIEQYIHLPKIISILFISVLASMGLSSNSLKLSVNNIVNEMNDLDKRSLLSVLINQDTQKLSEKQLYSSLIETYAKNLSCCLIAPLFYLVLFGLPGIILYKAILILNSYLADRNSHYNNFQKAPLSFAYILNFIPEIITALFILFLSGYKVSINRAIQEASKYSTTLNGTYPVAAAALVFGVKIGDAVYYGDQRVERDIIGEEITENYKEAVLKLIAVHSNMEKLLLGSLLVIFVFYLY